MSTALITHSACLEHVTPPGHPEEVGRLRAVLAALETEPFQDLVRVEAPEAEVGLIDRLHEPQLMEMVRDLAAQTELSGWSAIDGDTFVSPGSWRAALRAAGACVKAVDMVMGGEVGNAFCAVRPPGHHAERARAMGFCFINNAAAAALHAMEAHGLNRVAIVDFDVHHGNGTQDLFQNDGRVLYVSTHQAPLFPGTGYASETGVGNIVNLPLPAMTGSAEFRDAFLMAIDPALARHAPELVIISAGFDAHKSDPLAQLRLGEEDFVWATEQLCDYAQNHCRGRVISTLEGGYDLRALARSAAAHVETLMRYGVRAPR